MMPTALDLNDARKGIRTKEGLEMAKKKFQLDRNKADKNGDGEVTELEKVQGEAEQRTVGKDDLVNMSHGGLMCGDMEDDLPIGASPENVADDIPAMLSQDEYVLPAHVVKWYGLMHIQQMQSEAEAGLMAMSMAGLIGGEDPDQMSEEELYEGSEADVTEDAYEGEIESATVEVSDELEGEDYELEPQTAPLPGMMKRQKWAFIIS